MADDHATHCEAVPKLAGWSRNPEATAAATVGISGGDKNVPVAFSGEEISPEVKPAHAQHSFADVSVALTEGSACEDLKHESRTSGGAGAGAGRIYVAAFNEAVAAATFRQSCCKRRERLDVTNTAGGLPELLPRETRGSVLGVMAASTAAAAVLSLPGVLLDASV